MSQFCIHISDKCQSHEWGYSPTVGTYTCMKCSERRDYNDPQYADAEREYQAQVRNMQQSSDVVCPVCKRAMSVCNGFHRTDADKGNSSNAFGDDPIPVAACKCGYQWHEGRLPEEICSRGNGEYCVVCPRCQASGELKATPLWAVAAWNHLHGEQSSDMVARVARVVEDAPFDAWSIAEAALEACHHAELVEMVRLARGIIVEDANACRAFREEWEGLSGPENVLNRLDGLLAKIEGVQ